MALILHKVLYERLSTHPEWRQFRETFKVLAGLDVHLFEVPPGGDAKLLSSKIDVRGVLVGVLVADGKNRDEGRRKACRYLLSMAAERFSSILAMSTVDAHERLPAAVLQTSGWIQSRALTHEVRLSEAAEACGLSPSHLSRIFHQSTGMTFQEYVRRFRLDRACELLTTTHQSVTAIAFESGFQSISQFHRSFKAVYGKRPLEYRAAHG